jgi:nucleotide-binding universal stress UspA family protein
MTTTQARPDDADGAVTPSGAGRIVVGVDGSSASIAALEWAIKQAKLTNVGVDAAITWSVPATAAAAGGLPETYDPAGDAAKALAEAVASSRAAHPDVELRTVEIEGPAGPSLVDYAAKAELLVIGSRGHGFVSGLLLGSVSEYCVSHAHIPVLVLREAPTS